MDYRTGLGPPVVRGSTAVFHFSTKKTPRKRCESKGLQKQMQNNDKDTNKSRCTTPTTCKPAARETQWPAMMQWPQKQRNLNDRKDAEWPKSNTELKTSGSLSALLHVCPHLLVYWHSLSLQCGAFQMQWICNESDLSCSGASKRNDKRRSVSHATSSATQPLLILMAKHRNTPTELHP